MIYLAKQVGIDIGQTGTPGMIHDEFDQLIALERQARWGEILEIAERYRNDAVQADYPAWFWFFYGDALLQTGRSEEAVKATERGLVVAPSDRWGNKLHFDALIAEGCHGRAFDDYRRFIEMGDGRESEKEWFVEKAAELGNIEVAAQMNLTRAKIAKVPALPRYALALQCFIKVDTLRKVLDSFLHLDSSQDFSLIILQDSIDGSIYGAHRKHIAEQVTTLIGSYVPLLSKKFYSVEFLHNSTNLGTAPSCKRLLDYVASAHHGFLFVEDDCLLDRSALEWTRYHLEKNVHADGSWFVSCESSYFDSAKREISVEANHLLELLARHEAFSDAYCHVDYVPSTCFATRTEFWRLCANVRSFTRGPESLNLLMRRHETKTIVPIVPRAADIGMTHELGYSVQSLGLDNVKEVKNVVCLSDAKFDESRCIEFSGNLHEVFEATSEMNAGRLRDLCALYSIDVEARPDTIALGGVK